MEGTGNHHLTHFLARAREMANQVLHYDGAHYHVMLRGNRQQAVFFEWLDYDRFSRRFAIALDKFDASCHAFCWMTNHVHALISVRETPLHRVVHHFAGSYASELNKRRDLVGHTFQGRYRAELIKNTMHLQTVVRYIHLNPVEAGLSRSPGDYPWSSYRAYLVGARWPFLDTMFVMSTFGERMEHAMRGFQEFHERRTNYLPCWDVLPSEDPVDHVIDARSLDGIVREACQRFSVTEAEIASPAKTPVLAEARAWIGHEAVRAGTASVSQVAHRLGRTRQALHALMGRRPAGG